MALGVQAPFPRWSEETGREPWGHRSVSCGKRAQPSCQTGIPHFLRKHFVECFPGSCAHSVRLQAVPQCDRWWVGALEASWR